MKYTKLWMVLLITGMTSCGGKNDAAQQKAPPPVPVNTFTIQPGSALYYDQFPATVTALNQVEVRPQVSGYITGIFFTEGTHVNKGDKLYTIDPQQYLGSYEQAQANLSVAKANLAKAQQDADRYQELADKDAIARQTLDHALADLEASKKQVDAAKANVSAVETNLRYSVITAPFSGTIGISQVKLGASVSPGQTLLNTISSDDPITVDVAVDQKLIPKFIQLQQQKNVIADSIFYIVLADQSRYPYPGHIYLIDRAVDPQTGAIQTRLQFPNPKKELKVGMTCNVFVKNTTGAQSILIPYKAVTEQMGEFFVFVVGDSNKVSQHKILLGQRINDKVVVRNGLEINQQIVIDGMQKLREGSVVQPAAPKQDSTKVASVSHDSTKGK
ncbi:MAG: efflux RND transporter periplasmic adaptor subunit [Bacteroidetes bacterium]|nr:efflux RND transporter periplasmic adaptor subunit [Bacteroidota bacterium]